MRRAAISLVFIGVVGGLFFWGSDYWEPAPPPAKEVSLAAVEVGLVDEVVVRGEFPLNMKKQGGRWLLESGRAVAPAAIRRLLGSLKKIQSNHQLASRADVSTLRSWGLDSDNGVFVVLKSKGSAVVEFGVGRIEGGRAPMLINGAVYAVKGIYPAIYSRPRNTWIKKTLFEFKSGDIAAVTIERKGEQPFSVIEGAGKLVLKREEGSRGESFFDPALLEGLFEMISGLRFKATPGPVSFEADSKEGVRITIQLKPHLGLSRYTLLVAGNATDEGVAVRWVERNQIFRIDSRVARGLGRRALEYRTFPLMDFDPDEIRGFKLFSSSEYLSFVREGDGWKLLDAFPELEPGFVLDSTLVDARLRAMAKARAGAVAGAPKGTRVRFLKEGPRLVARPVSGESYQLDFGARFEVAGGEGWFARGNVDSRVYTVSDSLRRGLLKGIESFETRGRRAVSGGITKGASTGNRNLPTQMPQGVLKRLQDPGAR